MILVNTRIRRDSTMIDLGDCEEASYLSLPKILIPNSDEFLDVVNKYPKYKDYYVKVNLREGSKIRLSSNSTDYIFGCNDKMKAVFGTIQEVQRIRKDGRIFFKTQNRVLLEWSYGIGEISEIIEY